MAPDTAIFKSQFSIFDLLAVITLVALVFAVFHESPMESAQLARWMAFLLATSGIGCGATGLLLASEVNAAGISRAVVTSLFLCTIPAWMPVSWKSGNLPALVAQWALTNAMILASLWTIRCAGFRLIRPHLRPTPTRVRGSISAYGPRTNC